MPKYPAYAQRLENIPGAIFEKFRDRMRQQGDNLVKLHIGDTFQHPVYPLPLSSDFTAQHENFNRYCNTFGVPQLTGALANKLAEDNGLLVQRDQILMTCGATNALSSTIKALLDPGEKIMLLTPCWPLFPGIVRSSDAVIVEAPLYSLLYDDPGLAIERYLEQFIEPGVSALYLNTPNNPSGKVLTQKQIEQVAAFAERHNLWVISDEAYDGLTFDGREHISIATLPGMKERTISVFTFSKILMFAGIRLGYAVGSTNTIKNVNKIMVHEIYSPATFSQQMMVKPVQTRNEWAEGVRLSYQHFRDIFVEEAAFSFPVPEATYFLFFSIEPYLNHRDYWDVVYTLFDQGVSVAPGGDFGKGFENYIRVCFTGEPEERLRAGIRRMNKVLVGK